MILPAFPLFCRIAFDILGLLFDVSLRNVFSSSVQYNKGILIGIVLNMYNNFGTMDICTILVLSIQELGTPFPFLKSTSISFLSYVIFIVKILFLPL